MNAFNFIFSHLLFGNFMSKSLGLFQSTNESNLVVYSIRHQSPIIQQFICRFSLEWIWECKQNERKKLLIYKYTSFRNYEHKVGFVHWKQINLAWVSLKFYTICGFSSEMHVKLLKLRCLFLEHYFSSRDETQ